MTMEKHNCSAEAHKFYRAGHLGTSLDLVCMFCGKPFHACSQEEKNLSDQTIYTIPEWKDTLVEED